MATLLLFLLALGSASGAGPGCQDTNGNTAEAVNLRSQCNTESLVPAESGCFDRSKDVFGFKIWATPDLPQWALDHSAAVMAQYLDSNEDGIVDYPNLVAWLLQHNNKPGAVGNHRDYAVIQCRGDIGSGQLKDILLGVTRTGGQSTLAADTAYLKVAIEEFHHTIHRGLAGLHPNVFGTALSSELLLSFAQTIDNCAVANECCTSTSCNCLPTYNCQCKDQSSCTPNEYSCSFVSGSCTGLYHYPDVGCDRTCAGGAEFFYIGWMTYYGFNQASGPLGGDCLAVSTTEWEICTSAALVANSKTQLIYKLVTGQAASAQTEGYILPTTLPDGVYTATMQPVTGVTWGVGDAPAAASSSSSSFSPSSSGASSNGCSDPRSLLLWPTVAVLFALGWGAQ